MCNGWWHHPAPIGCWLMDCLSTLREISVMCHLTLPLSLTYLTCFINDIHENMKGMVSMADYRLHRPWRDNPFKEGQSDTNVTSCCELKAQCDRNSVSAISFHFSFHKHSGCRWGNCDEICPKPWVSKQQTWLSDSRVCFLFHLLWLEPRDQNSQRSKNWKPRW